MEAKLFVMFFKRILLLIIFPLFLLYFSCSNEKKVVKNVYQYSSIYDLYLQANELDPSTVRYIKNHYLIDLLVNASKNEQNGLYHQAIVDLLDAYRFDTSKVILFALAKNFYFLEKLTLAFDYAFKAYVLDTNFIPTIELLEWILITRNQHSFAKFFSTKLLELKGDNITTQDLRTHLEILDRLDSTYNQSIKFLKNFKNKKFEDFINFNLLYRYSLQGDSLEEFNILRKIVSNKNNLRDVNQAILQRYLELLLTFSDYDEVINTIYNLSQTMNQTVLNGIYERLTTNINYFEQKIPGFTEKFINVLKSQKVDNYQSLTYILQLYRNLNDTNNVRLYAEKILNFEDIDFSTLSFAVINLFYFAGEKELAIKKYSNFKLKFMEFPSYYITLGELYYSNSQLKFAIDNFNKAISLDSQLFVPYYYLGSIYFDLENWEKSDYYYEKCLQILPYEPSALNNYAYSLIVRDTNLTYARLLIEKALELDPDNFNFLDTYGWYYYKIGEYEKARNCIEKSIKKDSSRAEPFLHLSLILKALGDNENAKLYFEKAVSIDPNNKEVLKEIEQNK